MDYGKMDCSCIVNRDEINAFKHECVYKTDVMCDNDINELCIIVMQEDYTILKLLQKLSFYMAILENPSGTYVI